jgi:hypothetical protein
MQLVCRDEVVGKASMDPRVIEEYKKDKNYIVLSDFSSSVGMRRSVPRPLPAGRAVSSSTGPR